MPATEQTWRDQKTLHVIFGVSSLVMLLITIWMLSADNEREWKKFQRASRALDAWTADAQMVQRQSQDYHKDLTARQAAYDAALATPPAEADLKTFERIFLGDPKAPVYETRVAIWQPVVQTYTDLTAADSESSRHALRSRLMKQLTAILVKIKFDETNTGSAKKFRSADYDVVKSNLDLGIGNEADEQTLVELQKDIDVVKSDLDDRVKTYQEAITRRKQAFAAFDKIRAEELAAAKALDDQRIALKRLADSKEERRYDWSKRLVDAPILNAFNAPSKVDNIWLPQLTINNNFRDIARHDRCTTCHQSIDKVAAGLPGMPAYEPLRQITLSLAAPATAPAADAPAVAPEAQLETFYGLKVAETSLVESSEVRVVAVNAESPAAVAGLQLGDRLVEVGGLPKTDSLDKVYQQLVSTVKFGQPIAVVVERGFNHPLASHPRLDLYLTSTSPHQLKDFGCTICHDGQGLATAFKFASHTPNAPQQAQDWTDRQGWFNSHDWIFPMTSQRFLQSNCLKCHHDVTELEPSVRFPEPPAEKLMRGYHTIRQYGCFGCHEINGYDGPNKRIGPDMRPEPNYSAAASALAATKELTDEQLAWARVLREHPDDDGARHRLSDSIQAAANSDSKPSPAVVKLAGLLSDSETPGKLRKVGPSLRHVAVKSDFDFLYSWIRRPRDFRESTKMPQFFGQYEHLDEADAAHTQQLEGIEIRAISEYLLSHSQPLDQPHRAVKGDAERGKSAFEIRGCLACHQHSDFPNAKMTQGPDLSRMGGKLARTGSLGETWLYNWLKNPNLYHPRTLMPNLILDPVEGPDGKLTDPAADIAAYLLQSGRDWKPENIPSRKQLSADEQKTLHDLSWEHLVAAVPNQRLAKQYLENGIDPAHADEFKGDEQELVGNGMNDNKLLAYVGRRALSKYGCSGCHDVPGYEDAKSIGTGLADWGRKTADKLAFEQVVEFYQHHNHGDAEGGHLDPVKMADQDKAYFVSRLMAHDRQGFIWQKLHLPRSYDYMKTRNKGYNERLRMPRFNFTDDQIEAVMTFVLGLVAEPPAMQYQYRPKGPRAAIVEGERLLEKYNCTGCHTVRMERWKLALKPGELSEPNEIEDFPFLKPGLSPQKLKASLEKDRAGFEHPEVVGSPKLSPENGALALIDEDGAPIEPDDTTSRAFAKFTPWETSAVDGHIREAAVQDLLIPMDRVQKRYPPMGGYLARLIFPAVVAEESKVNPTAKDKADEMWGWLPPPLVGEGQKVQSNWLHDFLLDPYPIRPAAVLRMPKFNLSSAEASALAAYFAAVDGVDYPYDYDPRTSTAHLDRADAKHPGHLNDALKLVVSGDGCVKCHLVGDYSPPGSDRAKGPHLDLVYKRLRPSYLRNWIANPKRILPYTAMLTPLSSTQDKFQDLYKGSSVEQLNALVDLLSNYDRYMEQKTSIKRLTPATGGSSASSNR